MTTSCIIEDAKSNLPDIHFRTFLKHKKKYSFSNSKIVAYIQAHNHSIWALEMSPNGKYIVSGGEDKIINFNLE